MPENNLVMDSKVFSDFLRHIQSILDESRAKLDSVISKNEELHSYDEVVKSKDLVRLYGEAADDYTKLSFLHSGVNEAIMDLRTIRRELVSDRTSLAPSLAKTYKSRIDSMISDLEIFRDSIQSARQGVEVRVRFFNSCTYSFYEKSMGAKV